MKRKVVYWLAMVAALSLLVAACGPSGARPDSETGEIKIIQEDDEEGMNFDPENVVLTAGQEVTIILENHGSKDHEFMVGQEVVYTDAGAPNGFDVDFFEGIEEQVEVDLGDGAMLMIDGETVAMGGMGMEEGEMEMEGEGHEGEEGHEDDEGHEGEEGAHEEEEGMAMHMGHAGWMVMDAAGSAPTRITFTVPEDRVGEWIMGCFQDDGSHFEDGMRGTLIVQAP